MNKNFMLNHFHPVIHFANRLECKSGDQFGPRTINGYQFIFVQRGTGEIKIGRNSYRATSGCLFHYGPEVPHQINASQDDPFVLFGLHYLPEGVLEENIPTHIVEIEQTSPNSLVQFELIDMDSEAWSFPPQLQTGMWPLPFFENFSREFTEEKTFVTVSLRGLFMQFIVTLLRWIEINQPSSSPFDRYLLTIREQLNERAEEAFDPNWLEKWSPYSSDYITRLFRDRFGDTPHKYHTTRKVIAARRLLEETTLTITEIAEQLHFGSIHYFCKWYKKMTGEQPANYRKRRRLL